MWQSVLLLDLLNEMCDLTSFYNSKNVTEQEGGGGSFTINYYRKDSPFLSLEVPSPTPTC